MLRWTAPKSGQFNLATKFTGLCGKTQRTFADVYILFRGKMILRDSLNVEDRPNELSSEKTIFADEGETVDFVVGSGSAGAECRSTGVDVRVTEG